jgi:hypothetical protein
MRKRFVLKHLLWLGALILLVGSSCKKDFETFIPNPVDPSTLIPQVTTSLGGVVWDENGNPVEGVQVSVHGAETLSDENGVFFFADIEVPAPRTHIVADHPGYFLSSKTLVTEEGGLDQLQLRMIKQEAVETIPSGQDVVVQLDEGGRILFSASSLQQENGSAFNGEATVYARWIDPQLDAFYELATGASFGLSKTEELFALESYGIMLVEVRDPQGNLLAIAEGDDIDLVFPIDAPLLSDAPFTLTSWQFDESLGWWREENTADRINDKYLGSVSGTGIWNFAAPRSTIQLNGRVTDSNGDALSFTRVEVRYLNGAVAQSDRAKADGSFDFAIPANRQLILRLTGDCGTTYFELPLGPLSEDVNLPPIIIDDAEIPVYRISGSVLDCEENPLSAAYVLANIGLDPLLFLVWEGKFQGVIVACEAASITYIARDLNSAEQSVSFDIPLSPEINAGAILVCDNFDEFLTYNLDGVDFISPNPDGFQEAGFTHILASQPGLNLVIEGTEEGTYPLIFESFQLNSFDSDNTVFVDIQLTINEYGAPGEYILGTLSGSFKDTDGEDHSVGGSFKVVRDF